MYTHSHVQHNMFEDTCSQTWNYFYWAELNYSEEQNPPSGGPEVKPDHITNPKQTHSCTHALHTNADITHGIIHACKNKAHKMCTQVAAKQITRAYKVSLFLSRCHTLP